MSGTHAIADSPLGLHVGQGRYLFAVALEVGWRRTPNVIYFSARNVEEVRATLVKNVRGLLPAGSKVVGVAPAIGISHDEQGVDLRA